MGRPPRWRSSSTSSKEAESLAPGVTTGKARSRPGTSGATQCLAGSHPVSVAGHGVDLAVVAQVTVRVGERPRREGVGREARVDDGEPALDSLVGEVGEELGQLMGGQHALVDDGAGRQGDDVAARVLVLEPLPGHESHPVDGEGRVGPIDGLLIGGCHEDLVHGGSSSRGDRAQGAVVDRHPPPSDDREPLIGQHPLEGPARLAGLGIVTGAAHDARRIATRGRELEVDTAGVELVGQLQEDPGAVAAVLFAARRPPVGEMLEGGQRTAHELVARTALQVGDQADPAGVVLEPAVIEPAGRRWP